MRGSHLSGPFMEGNGLLLIGLLRKAKQQWEEGSQPVWRGLTQPTCDLPPLDWRGREFSFGLDLSAFTCLLCHVTLVGSNASALKLHSASFALTPQVGVLSPKNVHCKAVLETQSGMTGGWGQLVQSCRTRAFKFWGAQETSGRNSDGH